MRVASFESPRRARHDSGVGSPNGQELATRGTITCQVHDFETNLRGYNILVDTVKQVDIEKTTMWGT